VTAPAGFDEPHTFLVTLTTPDDQVIAAIDLRYELAIEPAEQFCTDGIYIDPTLTGARIVVDDGTTSAAFHLVPAECIVAAHYLLACAKAAFDRAAGT
jgi:hypothetical protein